MEKINLASYTCNYLQLQIQNYLQGGKNVMTYCLTVQIFHWLFCVRNLDSQHCELDFKIESVCSVVNYWKPGERK